jgi:tetratricopeptide (TPR) repeat protein
MRAQIVDEISGLSGIEGLIKDVGLDHHRFGRELTETEKKMEEVRKQLHPAADLKEEGQTLEKAESEFEKHKDCEQIAVEGNNLYLKWNQVDQQISTLLWNESKIPDTDAALLDIARADGLLVRADLAEKLYRDGTAAAGRLSAIDKALAGIPDSHAAALYLDASGAALVVFENATDLFKKWDEANKAIVVKEKREKELDAALKAENEIQTAQDLMTFCTMAETLLQAHHKVVANMAVVDRQLEEKDKALKDAEKERDEILASVTTCPLTLRPVSKECLV